MCIGTVGAGVNREVVWGDSDGGLSLCSSRVSG